MKVVGRSLVVVSMLVASAAFAADVVTVKADVVLLSTEGTVIDPPALAALKKQFEKSGLTAFTSYKRLSTQQLTLSQGKPATLNLPNNRKTTVALDKLKEDTAHLRVSIEKLFEGISYRLSSDDSVIIHSGAHQNGTLVLVLSPADAAATKKEPAKPEEKK